VRVTAGANYLCDDSRVAFSLDQTVADPVATRARRYGGNEGDPVYQLDRNRRMALLGLVTVLGGCEGMPAESAGSAPSAENAPGASIEVRPNAVTVARVIGNSSYSTNFNCTGGRVCTCDTSASRWDCVNLADSQMCGGPMTCIDRPNGGRECICKQSIGGGGTGCTTDPDKCALADGYTAPGLYQRAGSPDILKKLYTGDRACRLTYEQWQALGFPSFEVVSGKKMDYLSGYILTPTPQTCSNEEAGVTHSHAAFPNGLYRTPDGQVMMLTGPGLRACHVSSGQWVQAGKPTVYLMNSTQGAQFLNSFQAPNPAASCIAAEFAAR
jgi:hypothetical protein